MKTTHPLPSPSRTSLAAIASARNAGFALVITLSLMVLLMLLALGMLSLSSVSLRTAAQSSDMNLARANARMALLLALGELQTHAGSDTRVTARADILDEDTNGDGDYDDPEDIKNPLGHIGYRRPRHKYYHQMNLTLFGHIEYHHF